MERNQLATTGEPIGMSDEQTNHIAEGCKLQRKGQSKFRYTLTICALCIEREKLKQRIDDHVSNAEISSLASLLWYFYYAWHAEWSNGSVEKDNRSFLKSAFRDVMSSVIESLLRHGLFLMLTPREMNFHHKEMRKGISKTICQLNADVDDLENFLDPSDMNTYIGHDQVTEVIRICYMTKRLPRLNIETIVKYIEMTNMTLATTSTNDAFILEHLNATKISDAEKKTGTVLIEHLKRGHLYKPFPIDWLFYIINEFDKSTIKRLAYCTAIFTYSTPWQSRPIEVKKKNPKNPEDACDMHGWDHDDILDKEKYVEKYLNSTDCNSPTSDAEAKILGLTVKEMKKKMEDFNYASRPGKRLRELS